MLNIFVYGYLSEFLLLIVKKLLREYLILFYIVVKFGLK